MLRARLCKLCAWCSGGLGRRVEQLVRVVLSGNFMWCDEGRVVRPQSTGRDLSRRTQRVPRLQGACIVPQRIARPTIGRDHVCPASHFTSCGEQRRADVAETMEFPVKATMSTAEIPRMGAENPPRLLCTCQGAQTSQYRAEQRHVQSELAGQDSRRSQQEQDIHSHSCHDAVLSCSSGWGGKIHKRS